MAYPVHDRVPFVYGYLTLPNAVHRLLIHYQSTINFKMKSTLSHSRVHQPISGLLRGAQNHPPTTVSD